MSGIAVLRPGHRWKAVLLILAASAIILAGGVLVGYASGRSKALSRQQPAVPSAPSTEPKVQLTWLPAPGSEAALKWLADPSTPGWLGDVYTHHQDSLSITAERTEAFFKLLQHAMGTPAAAPAAPAGSLPLTAVPPHRPHLFQQYRAARSKLKSNRAAQSTAVAVAADRAHNSSTSNDSQLCSPATGLQPFITAAGDVLSYLRYKQSKALLDLLRGFSKDGLKGLAAFEANTTLLRQEVQQLLSPERLQQWYLEVASSRVGAVSPEGQQDTELLVGVGQLVHRSHRRLLSSDSNAVPFDLTAALLSKMQGTAPPAAAAATPEVSGGGDAAAAAMDAETEAPAPAVWVPAKITIARPQAAAAPHVLGATAVADPGQLPYELVDYDEYGEYGGVQGSIDGYEPAGTSTDVAGATQAPSSAQNRNRSTQLPARPLMVGSRGNVNYHHSNSAAHSAQGSASSSGSSNAHPLADRATQPAEAILEQGWMALQPLDSADDYLQPVEAPQAAAISSPGMQDQQPQEAAVEELKGGSPAARPAAGLASVVRNGNVTEDLVCAVQQFSPIRQQGGAAGLVGCKPWASLHSQASWGLRIITIPIVFHCLTFAKAVPKPPYLGASPAPEAAPTHVVLPPNWHTAKAAVDLVDQANRAFLNTGIQFRLLEVRQDPTQHPYLQQPGLDAWQSCTYSWARPATGIACLHDVARRASPVPTHAVHVFVAGSRQERAYCGNLQTEVCRTLAAGYSHAPGPWMGVQASPAWREESTADNWIWISWDTLNPGTANSVRFAHSGGSVFASQLARYLGLSGSAAAVAAAPSSTCSGSSRLPALSSWCRAFRLGKEPPTSQLSAHINSSANAFDILEPSVPDNCAMAFSAGQIAALRAAVTVHRPTLLQAWTLS